MYVYVYMYMYMYMYMNMNTHMYMCVPNTHDQRSVNTHTHIQNMYCHSAYPYTRDEQMHVSTPCTGWYGVVNCEMYSTIVHKPPCIVDTVMKPE